MKRAASALVVAIGLAAITVAPASAAVTTQGAVKMTWNVSPSATLNLTTNYTGAGAQGATQSAATLNPSAAGVCSSAATPAETAFQLSFGNLTPSVTLATQCVYTSAIAAKVVTNSTNWTITQGLTAALTNASSICAYANGAADAAAPTASTHLAATPFTPGTTCGGVTVGVVGATVSGSVAGDPSTPSVFQTSGAVPSAFCTSTTSGTRWCTEDIGIILAANQATTAVPASAFMIVQLVAN